MVVEVNRGDRGRRTDKFPMDITKIEQVNRKDAFPGVVEPRRGALEVSDTDYDSKPHLKWNAV